MEEGGFSWNLIEKFIVDQKQLKLALATEERRDRGKEGGGVGWEVSG